MPTGPFAGLVALLVFAAVLVFALFLARGNPLAGSPDGDGGRPTVIGYVPYWDQVRAFDVATAHLHLFDEISPVWYAPEPSGGVELADAEHTVVDPAAVAHLRAEGVRVVPTVTNLRSGEWDTETVQSVVRDPDTRRAHIRELVNLAVTEDYDGLDIDYEDLDAADREPFTEFVVDLAAALHAEDKILTVDVHPKTSESGDDGRNQAQDFAAIGAAADQVRLMTYDYSWDTSPPGPVAPADWVEEVVAWTVTQIPAHKVILGIDLLGYDWADGHGETVDHAQVQDLLAEHGSTVNRTDDGTPWFVYHDAGGTRHEVWFEDAESAGAKLELVADYDLGGAFFWRLGGEDAAVWDDEMCHLGCPEQHPR
ncbi:peptidoglycan hydrolase [Actinobacteria bacterium YIM 96077]|uniref:Peptidoglycan hydrolase n=1 Tax=Phytoactinopolyspora halophila TaxID=1981511 RepID=A0A329QDY3_9ACTN|nr:glycosyl hydrolase family 18 protein [Phytoactinopolyspora halophila]AYY12677.1 peptidoglycan hydrolase [Actinobacteria bacterium YIM 96077]RAW10590.1 peptidoglycan hydrolase [Phytoactinopolyspora halophila]